MNNYLIDFNNIDFKVGDGVFIPEGERHKHKAMIKKDEKAILILFEKL